MEVPAEVEEYLLGEYVSAGRAGGAIGGGAAGALGGGWGPRLAARLGWIRTKVEHRSGDVAGTPDEVVERVLAEFPGTTRLPAEGLVRLAVPVGALGMQSVLVDLAFGRPVDRAVVPLRLTAYGKEGVLQRAPTKKAADRVWEVASRASRG